MNQPNIAIPVSINCRLMNDQYDDLHNTLKNMENIMSTHRENLIKDENEIEVEQKQISNISL